jgi:hypothetical protein
VTGQLRAEALELIPTSIEKWKLLLNRHSC